MTWLVVTARATPKAVQVARSALGTAGLGWVPLVTRDARAFDNSPDGLVRYKEAVIRAALDAPAVAGGAGIGDLDTDVIAYSRCGLRALRIRWFEDDRGRQHPALDGASAPANLSGVWASVHAELLSLTAKVYS